MSDQMNIGDRVTVEHNSAFDKEYIEDACKVRRSSNGWVGTIVAQHDSHGLCYDVEFPGGMKATFEPAELKKEPGGILIGDAVGRPIGAYALVVGTMASSQGEASVVLGIGAKGGRGSVAIGHGVEALDGECKIEVTDWYDFFHELRETVTNPKADTPENAKIEWQKRKRALFPEKF